MLTFTALQLASHAVVADPLAESVASDHDRSVFLLALLLASFMVAGIAAVWGGVYLAMRWRRSSPEAKAEKRSLLDRLATVHDLSGDDVQRLKTLAANRSPVHAAMLLIDPRLLEAHAAEHPGEEWSLRMGERLFGSAFVRPGGRS